MKKLWICFSVVLLLLSLGAMPLAALPHAHGDDPDHSRHQSCPFHQISQGDWNLAVAVIFTFFAAAGFSLWEGRIYFAVKQTAARFHPLRAPPASS